MGKGLLSYQWCQIQVNEENIEKDFLHHFLPRPLPGVMTSNSHMGRLYSKGLSRPTEKNHILIYVGDGEEFLSWARMVLFH